jgi:hypothetical protein
MASQPSSRIEISTVNIPSILKGEICGSEAVKRLVEAAKDLEKEKKLILRVYTNHWLRNDHCADSCLLQMAS